MENQNNNELVNERKSSLENKTNNSIEDQFASAIPEWNLVPPAIVIKRVKRTI